MKERERAKLRRKLSKPDENGIYHYPCYGSFINMIGCLPAQEYREYWRLYDRQYLDGKQLSDKAATRLGDLGDKARQLWEQKRQDPPDTFFDDIAGRMWNRLTDEEKASWSAVNPTAAAKYLSTPS
jgi:hypothetical protein